MSTRTERALASIAIVAALVLLGGSVWSLITSEQHTGAAPPPLGVASVESREALLYRTPSITENVLQMLHRGERVNVLGSGGVNRQWVHVQVLAALNGGRTGYINVTDLGAWSTYRAVRLTQPRAGAPRAARIVYLQHVNRYLETHPESTDAEEAGIEAAAQSVALAEAAKSSGESPQEVQAYVESASKILGRIESTPDPSGKSSERALLQGLRQSLAMLQRGDVGPAGAQSPNLSVPATSATSGAAPPGPPAAEPPYDAAADLHRATTAWQNGEYARARRFLRRVLNNKPHDDEARELLERVTRAQAIDPGVTQ